MKIFKATMLSALLLLSLSCEKDEVKRKGDFEIIALSDLKFDVVFPQELWEELLRKAPPTVDIDKTAYDLFESLFVQVELIDGTKEVLGGKNYRFDFKDFGGEVNLNTYLNRDNVGSFKMQFNFPELSADSEMRVYFLSWSKQYSKDDEVFGNGCGYFYDVTSYFKKEALKNGLLLHTNGYRYFDVAVGRFYIVNYTKEKIQLAQITITDSHLIDRMCPDRI